MKDYKALIDQQKIPRHIALIMDGNGRWAEKRKLPRMEGHRRGAEVIEPLADAAIGLGVEVLSLYAFSTENWSRPASEVQGLWNLLELYFESQREKIRKKGIRIVLSGTMGRLADRTRKIIDIMKKETRQNRTLTMNFCINYGGQQEIVDAVNGWLKTRKGEEALTPARLARHLYVPQLPPVDLMIRTSGEYRISNFLLWQLAYAELIFLKVLWPDFKPGDLYKAVYEFQNRERRFGGL